MQKILVIAAIALFATTLAAPVVEDSWDVEDELLQRVHEDSTPLSLMQADSPTIAHAEAAKDKAAGEAKAAAGDEAKYTAEEATTGAAAKKLAAEDKANSDAAAKANLAAAKSAASYAASAMKKSAAANKATLAAKEQDAKFQKEMAGLEAKMAHEDGAAKDASKARLEKVKAGIAANDAEIKTQTTAGEKAAADLVKAHADLKAAHSKATGEYATKIKDLNAATKKAEGAFAKEKASADKAYNEKMAANKKEADAAEAAVAKEAKDNAAAASKEQAAIKDKFDKIDAAHNKVKASEQKTKKDQAKALAAKRGSEDKVKADAAVAADKANDARLKHIDDTLGAAARKAKKVAAASVAKAAADQVARKAASEAAAGFDSKLVDCNPNGNDYSCFDPKTRTCHDTACKSGSSSKLYMEQPSQHCTTKVIQCEDANYGYGNNGNDALEKAGIATTKAPTPSPPSAACTAAEASSGFQKGSSISAAACGPVKTNADEYALRDHAAAYLDMMTACTAGTQAPMCNDATAVKVDSKVASDQTVTKSCVDPGEYAGLKMQITDLPKYTASGTNGRFTAGLSSTACRLACSFELGFKKDGYTMPGASTSCAKFSAKSLMDAVHVHSKMAKGTVH
jgi:hypothetical protein